MSLKGMSDAVLTVWSRAADMGGEWTSTHLIRSVFEPSVLCAMTRCFAIRPDASAKQGQTAGDPLWALLNCEPELHRGSRLPVGPARLTFVPESVDARCTTFFGAGADGRSQADIVAAACSIGQCPGPFIALAPPRRVVEVSGYYACVRVCEGRVRLGFPGSMKPVSGSPNPRRTDDIGGGKYTMLAGGLIIGLSLHQYCTGASSSVHQVP